MSPGRAGRTAPEALLSQNAAEVEEGRRQLHAPHARREHADAVPHGEVDGRAVDAGHVVEEDGELVVEEGHARRVVDEVAWGQGSRTWLARERHAVAAG